MLNRFETCFINTAEDSVYYCKDVGTRNIKVPLDTFHMETGAYFPALDHSIPPTVSFENFRYFINLVREIAGMEKLPE